MIPLPSWRIPAVLLALLLAGCQTPPPPSAAPVTVSEPANLLPHKDELVAYIKDGRYDAGLAQVAAEAEAWVKERAARGGKLAIVFDLDETLLSNLRHMREMDFGYVPALWDQWVAEADAPVIEPVARVYRAARQAGVAVFYLTGRKESDRPGTEENLRRAGLADYAALHCKPNGDKGTTQAFKTARRREIEAQGYTIIANLGDQFSDLAGGHAEHTFKLPNPFYITR